MLSLTTNLFLTPLAGPFLIPKIYMPIWELKYLVNPRLTRFSINLLIQLIQVPIDLLRLIKEHSLYIVLKLHLLVFMLVVLFSCTERNQSWAHIIHIEGHIESMSDDEVSKHVKNFSTHVSIISVVTRLRSYVVKKAPVVFVVIYGLAEPKHHLLTCSTVDVVLHFLDDQVIIIVLQTLLQWTHNCTNFLFDAFSPFTEVKSD